MLNADSKMDEEAMKGHYEYIYGSPEVFLGNDKWRKTLKSQVFQENVKLIVIDEAHLVELW